MPHAGDSATQREAEIAVLRIVGTELGKEVRKRRVDLPGGTWVEVDGADDGLSVFIEAFAHIGPMKGGQKRKVALDVLKLITLQRTHTGAQLMLAFCDEAASDSITGWLDEAITAFGVHRRVVSLDRELRRRLLEAQARQFR